MKITIDITGYTGYILVESNQYTLVQTSINEWIDPVTKEKGANYGKLTEKEIGFFKNFGNAVNAAIQISFASRDEVMSIERFIEEYEATRISLLTLI